MEVVLHCKERSLFQVFKRIDRNFCESGSFMILSSSLRENQKEKTSTTSWSLLCRLKDSLVLGKKRKNCSLLSLKANVEKWNLKSKEYRLKDLQIMDI